MSSKGLVLAGLLAVTSATMSAQAPPMPSGPPPLGNPVASAAGACTVLGQLLSPADFGVPAGQVLADATAALLPDGRVRLYAFAQGVGIVSAVAVSPDGLSFIPEAGARLPDGSGMPRLVPLADGRVRLFFTSAGGIRSAISSDGLTFTVEDGMRITATQAGFASSTAGATSAPSVIQLADGRYRMYFSDLPRPGDPPGDHWVKSAVSADMLTWQMEEGVRLGPGAPVIGESSEHPFALSNPDGSVTVFYGRFAAGAIAGPEGLYQSTSADGLTFETEQFNVFMGNDPDAIRLADGTLMVY